MEDLNTISLHDEACAWCGSLPHEDHAPHCPDNDDERVLYCYACGVHYLTNCQCESEVQ